MKKVIVTVVVCLLGTLVLGEPLRCLDVDTQRYAQKKVQHLLYGNRDDTIWYCRQSGSFTPERRTLWIYGNSRDDGGYRHCAQQRAGYARSYPITCQAAWLEL